MKKPIFLLLILFIPSVFGYNANLYVEIKNNTASIYSDNSDRNTFPCGYDSEYSFLIPVELTGKEFNKNDILKLQKNADTYETGLETCTDEKREIELDLIKKEKEEFQCNAIKETKEICDERVKEVKEYKDSDLKNQNLALIIVNIIMFLGLMTMIIFKIVEVSKDVQKKRN